MSEAGASLYDGTMERTEDGGMIRFERRLPYAVEDVWDAITDPARLAEWWLPGEAEIKVDLRPGGSMVMATSGEQPMTITCTILRVEEPVLLEHTHVDPGSYIRWELEAVEAGCVLRLSQFVPDAGAAVDRCYVVGLHTSLSRLEPCLSGHPASWDWEAFSLARSHYAALGLAPSSDPEDG